jgi:hypothetical protein
LSNGGVVVDTIALGAATFAQSFTAKAQPATTYSSPSSVAVADLNEGGILDMTVTNAAANTVSVQLGKGDGTFGTSSTFAVDSVPEFVATRRFQP